MKKPREIIKQFSPQDALVVLENLVNSDAQLARRIAEVAMEYLREVDPEDIAAAVHHELDSLEVEDVWDKAGPSRDGYREPDEVADEMIGDVLEPYREDLSRYQRLNMLGTLWSTYLSGSKTMTIREVFDGFLEAQEQRLRHRTYSDYGSVCPTGRWILQR